MSKSTIDIETRALEVFRSLNEELQANSLRYLQYLRDIENTKRGSSISQDDK